MTTPEDEIEQVNVRAKWEHEALNFTPWLAKNLHLLGDALEMKLELDRDGSAGGPVLSRHTGEKDRRREPW